MHETQLRSISQGRSPGGGNGNPLQYSCLGNPMDRGARWATVHGVSESDTTERLTMQSGKTQEGLYQDLHTRGRGSPGTI